MVATWNGQVVGTLSIVEDSPQGLPIETTFEINKFRRPGNKLAEVTTLSIAPEARRHAPEIYFAMSKLVVETAVVRHYSYLFSVVNPRHENFYRDVQMFERLSPDAVAPYPLANGKLGVGLVLELASLRFKLLMSSSLETSRNLHDFYVIKRLRHFYPTFTE